MKLGSQGHKNTGNNPVLNNWRIKFRFMFEDIKRKFVLKNKELDQYLKPNSKIFV
jgi:hypothetical protein